MIKRKQTRAVRVRDLTIGGENPIVIQSMTNTSAHDVKGTVDQINRLTAAGCQVVRLAVPDNAAVEAFRAIRNQVDCPLVADIHFDYRLAIASIKAGADKIRINPGNIGDHLRVKAVTDEAQKAAIPIRIGVNSGSLEKKLLKKHGGATAQALVESALGYIELFDKLKFKNIILSIKASDVITTVEACSLLSEACDVPQHIGITESGTVRSGTIKSAVGIGSLLSRGIGDTIRVSLTGDPVEEIYVAKEILKSLDLHKGPVIISCPTCGRTNIDLSSLASRVEDLVLKLNAPLKIAVMGCVVNGPGEARDADIGVAGGKGEGLIFLKGNPVKKVAEENIIEELEKEIKKHMRKQP
ncbi:flavodoxin-dependent (E)-4-hydroxy-3-methylbut-2-enyl-diphosphate synthase [Chitinispirillales bacterium ANBcel5]|uniref:flavodoxin-dependent (E)-4-hydroxy-3-methylbut-2-enyl-diphosphate synthase n=1 Tax=Cellulosispirillum alkaliphilum TaxID=3039283 RepID=UPI002A4F91EA|nr:flavodoxin-dependent (E)-4-hydroxy-3-methylbut-2-enyl-diphosphate synthase [Chitinispirillales bacterium ANBcel5]